MIMISTKWKLATALGVAGAIALSVPAAEARSGRNAAIGFGIAAGALALGAAAAAASQPRYYYDNGPYYYGNGPYAYHPSAYDSYGYYDAPTVYYGPTYYGPAYPRAYSPHYQGRFIGTYNRQIPGLNYNPNQN
jgi:hypothetical protein